MSNNLDITSDDALLIVDVQNDFCPGGALAVEEGDQIIPVINEWIRNFADHGLPVFSSRDWHPAHHLSFEQEGGRWHITAAGARTKRTPGRRRQR